MPFFLISIFVDGFCDLRICDVLFVKSFFILEFWPLVFPDRLYFRVANKAANKKNSVRNYIFF